MSETMGERAPELDFLEDFSRQSPLPKWRLLDLSSEYPDRDVISRMLKEGCIALIEGREKALYEITPKGRSILSQMQSQPLIELDYKILGMLGILEPIYEEEFIVRFPEGILRDLVQDRLTHLDTYGYIRFEEEMEFFQILHLQPGGKEACL